MDDETISTSQVRIVLGYEHVSSARSWLSRRKIESVGRDKGTGEKLWPALAVRAALASRHQGPHPEIQP
jgi:hypothetical protein